MQMWVQDANAGQQVDEQEEQDHCRKIIFLPDFSLGNFHSGQDKSGNLGLVALGAKSSVGDKVK